MTLYSFALLYSFFSSSLLFHSELQSILSFSLHLPNNEEEVQKKRELNKERKKERKKSEMKGFFFSLD